MKKYIYIFFLIFAISFPGFGKNFHHHDQHEFLNSQIIVADNDTDEGIKTFTSSKFAKDIIQDILNVVGLKPNFEIRSAAISNAAAVNYGGKRFILYDPAFMERIEKATKTDWAAISILAHEIGHHLNGHTMLKGGNPSLELEADEFSGFVLRKMGASLEDAQKAMKIISNERGSATHPKRSLRLTAIANGYNSADKQLIAAANYNPEPQEENSNTIVTAQNNIDIEKADVFSEVYFNKLPNRKFFLTKKLELIEITKDSIDVLGDIVKIGNQLKLTIFDNEGKIILGISPKGEIFKDKNTVVGYLKLPTA